MIIEIIGWIGSALVLLAYFLVSSKKISPVSNNYQLMNLFGALGIIINSTVHHALPTVGLNVIWLLIAIYGLVKALQSRHKP